MKTALKLLAHVWPAAQGTPAGSSRDEQRRVEARTPLRWSPFPLPPSRREAATRSARGGDPVWAETEPCYHD